MKCLHFRLERLKNKLVCTECREVVEVLHPLFEMDGVTPVDAVDAIQYALNGSDWGKADDNEQKHLDHEFYKAAAAYREQMRIGQIIKGSKKYPEPFNPFSWSPRELLAHAMQENVDQGHYEYGLYLWIERLEKEVAEWKNEAQLAHDEIMRLAAERDNWRMAAINNHDCHKDTQIHWGPAYNQIRAVTCNQCGKVIMGELVDKEA